MKNILIKLGMLSVVILFMQCSDFEDINTDPLAANADQVQVEYFINGSIGGAQMNPHIAERVFVLYWKDAGHMDRIGTLSEGFVSDSWTSDYYNGYVSKWLKDITAGIAIAEQQIAEGNVKEYTSNLMHIARIWRVYVMSEFTDNFGPIPIDGFQGENPKYSSVKDVYYFMLEELKDATSQIDASISVPSNLAKFDPAYGYNYEKWIKYGNSLRMRLAMRLSEVEPTKAQQEFEDAVNSNMFIATLDDNFQVQETGGWSDYTGVMTRQWNSQYLSPTLNNLMIGLGGIKSEDQLPADLHDYIKPENYMGKRFLDHFTTLTNDPSAGFWLDGLHNTIDPRAYANYAIPGDFDNPEFNTYPSWNNAASTTKEKLLNDDGTTLIEVDAAFTWNTSVAGEWGDKGAKNRLRRTGTIPRLINKFRDGSSQRVFFGSWESYFLIAEAAVRGWAVPMQGKDAYEAGIGESFSYSGVSSHLAEYLQSQNYNRAGTSVNWNHTTEPPATVSMDFVDGYTNTPGTYDFSYPENTIYEGGNIKNDHLNKIITQKFIAQVPWLPLETWSDHRRLGLPFFENPAVENPLPNLPSLNAGNVMTNRVEFFGQRLKYPSSFETNLPDGYAQATELLGGVDEVHTPLWWAKQDD